MDNTNIIKLALIEALYQIKLVRKKLLSKRLWKTIISQNTLINNYCLLFKNVVCIYI